MSIIGALVGAEERCGKRGKTEKWWWEKGGRGGLLGIVYSANSTDAACLSCISPFSQPPPLLHSTLHPSLLLSLPGKRGPAALFPTPLLPTTTTLTCFSHAAGFKGAEKWEKAVEGRRRGKKRERRKKEQRPCRREERRRGEDGK